MKVIHLSKDPEQQRYITQMDREDLEMEDQQGRIIEFSRNVTKDLKNQR